MRFQFKFRILKPGSRFGPNGQRTDVVIDPSSRARVILEVSIVTIGSDTSLGRGARAGLDRVNAQLRAREEDKRYHSVVQRLHNEAGNNTLFTPIVKYRYVSLWSYEPLDGGLPQRSLRPRQGSRQVPHVAAASTDAHVEHDGGLVVLVHALEHSVRGHGRRTRTRIILYDNALNLPVVARQPHRPNHESRESLVLSK